MAKFADNNEKIEIETFECFVRYSSNFEDDFIAVNFTIAGIPKDVYESDEDEALRNYLEKKGKPILNRIISPKFQKLKWELEDFD